MKLSATACCLAALGLTAVAAVPLPTSTKEFYQGDLRGLFPRSIPPQAQPTGFFTSEHPATKGKFDVGLIWGLGDPTVVGPGPHRPISRSDPEDEHEVENEDEDQDGLPHGIEPASPPPDCAAGSHNVRVKHVWPIGPGVQVTLEDICAPDDVQARSMPIETSPPQPFKVVISR